MNHIERDYGFVLRRHNFRETSLIITFYSKRFGKVTGILKGFHTLKKEFASPVDIFTLNEFVFYPRKREIWLVSAVDLVADYPYLRHDHDRANIGGIFLNIIDRTMGMWDSHPEVFFLLKDSLVWLGKEDPLKVLTIFLIKFLTLSGFKPEFNRCLFCHTVVGETVFFSVQKGGLVCEGCAHGPQIQRIEKETSSSLLYVQNNDAPHVYRINPTPAARKEILYILQEFVTHHLEMDFFSKLLVKV